MACVWKSQNFKRIYSHVLQHATKRGYAKGLKRMVKNVTLSERAEEIIDSKTKPMSWHTRLEGTKLWKNPYKDEVFDPSEDTSEQTTVREEAKYRYTFIDRNENWFGRLILDAKSKTSRKERTERRHVLLEGEKMINDAVKAGVDITHVFADCVTNLNKLDFPEDCSTEFFRVSPSRIKALSDLKSYPGTFAIAKLPQEKEVDKENLLPMTLVLDGIREPGDLGTLIRTAAVAGCQSVLVMSNCVDAWSNRVIRAGACAHFRIPLIIDKYWTHIYNYMPEQSNVYLVQQQRGVREMKNRQLAELMRKENEEASELESFNLDGVKVDPSLSLSHAEAYASVHISETSLFEFSIGSKDHVTIIVSGQEGPSGQAKKLLLDHRGEAVAIPSEDEIVSTLNTAITGCMLIMESKRQLLLRKTEKQSLEKE